MLCLGGDYRIAHLRRPGAQRCIVPQSSVMGGTAQQCQLQPGSHEPRPSPPTLSWELEPRPSFGVMFTNWWPLRFSKRAEAAYQADRALSWTRLDQAVMIPWGLLWVSIIKRHWAILSYLAILKSFCSFIVIVSPSYLQLVLGKQRYSRWRIWAVALAKTAYIMHSGGGLYRDSVMTLDNTLLGAANLFVRLAVGSRTLFWLVLAFGYQMPPHLQVPFDALFVGIMMWMKPSTPFCSVMQSPATAPLFETIANWLPLFSLMPMGRPQLVEGADVCNPLISWMQIGLGYLLPTLAFVCIDVAARRRYAVRHPGALPPRDARRWAASKTAAAFNPWAIMALVYPHMLTALWYALMWRQLDFSVPPYDAGPGAVAAGAAAGAGAASG